MTHEKENHGNHGGNRDAVQQVPTGTEVRGQVQNYKVEVVVRNSDGTVKEKRVETVSKAVK